MPTGGGAATGLLPSKGMNSIQDEAAPFVVGYYEGNRIRVHEFKCLDEALGAALDRFADRCAWIVEVDSGRVLCGWGQVQALKADAKR